MPKATGLDLILELWNSHGIFALGWVFVCFMALYIVYERKSKDALFREYISSVQTANAAVTPLLEKSVTVMTHVVTVIDSAVERAAVRDDVMQTLRGDIIGLKGQLDIVIRSFIEAQTYTGDAAVRGGERARRVATKVHVEENSRRRVRDTNVTEDDQSHD